MRRVWWLTTTLAVVTVAAAVQLAPATNAQELRLAANGRCPPGVPPILPSARLDRVPLGEPRLAQGLDGQRIRPEVFELTCIAPAGELVAGARTRGVETAVPGVARDLLDPDSGFGLGSVRFRDVALPFPEGGGTVVTLAEPGVDTASAPAPPPSLP